MGDLELVGEPGQTPLRIHRETRGPVTRVSLDGELDMDNVDDLRRVLAELVGTGQVRLEVNLRRLTFCDSCGLAALLNAAEACRRAGGDLTLSEATGAVRRVLAISGVDTVLSGRPSADLREAR